MFTGIVQAIGAVEAIEPSGGDWRLTIDTSELDLGDCRTGDSIAISGVCLTAVELGERSLQADISVETWQHTAFRTLESGSRVNLEKALLPTSRLGGHLVSGHVDGVGTLRQRRTEGRSERWTVELPTGLERYVADKGAICLDGVSLTVNRVVGHQIELNLVAHTLERTNFPDRCPGDGLNVEVDLIARYLERLLHTTAIPGEGFQGMDPEALARAGFI